MYDVAIATLEELARKNPEQSAHIGFAIGILRWCRKSRISRRDRVFRLPDCEAPFGYFIVQECGEDGTIIRTVVDSFGNPQEFLSSTLIIEQPDAPGVPDALDTSYGNK